MAITAPTHADVLPVGPSIDDPDDFDPQADAFAAAQRPFGIQMNALADNVFNNASEAYHQAQTAAESAATAQTAANTATAAANVTKWVSGTIYADGQVTWSPMDGLPYRRIGAGGGTTDPKIDAAHWTIQLLGLGLGGTTIVGSLTLTKSSAAAMVVNPSGPGLYVTLPDATELTLGAIQFTISNVGDYDYGVKDSVGNVLGWVWSGKTAVLGLSDKSTSAGIWSAADLQKVGVTALFSAPTISSADNNLVVLPVDAARTLVLFGNLYATMYDASTLTWASPVTVRLNTTICSAVLSGANQALVISITGNAGEAVTISLGASLTVNTANKATFTVPGSAQSIGTITQVAASWLFSTRDNVPATYIAAVTVSGNTPSVGSLTTVAASFNSDPVIIAAGTVARVFGLDGSNLYAKPYTVSGTTLTPGTSASDSTGGAFDSQFRAVQLGSGNVLVQYSAVSPVKVAIFKLSGTTENISTVTLSSLSGSGSTLSDLLLISSTKALVAAVDGANFLAYANIITDTSGSASAGTPYVSPILAATNCAALQVVGTTARIAYYAGNEAIETVFDCSGSSPVVVSRHIANQQVAMPAKSDRYGRRNYAKLTAGSAAYVVANGTKADGRFTAGGVQILPSLPVNFSSGAPGASASESWGLDRSQAVGGKVVKRFEVCA